MDRSLFFPFLVLALISHLLLPSHACLFGRKWRIFIMNGIDDQVVVRVRSKDDDLGNHTLYYNDSFNFAFCERIDSRTLFTSQWWWGSKTQGFAVFSEHLIHQCHIPRNAIQRCYWLARPEGFYLSSYNHTFPKDWQRKKGWVG